MPPMEDAIQTNDCNSPEEACGFFKEELDCFPVSATMASFATSTIEAPRFPSRRYTVIKKNELLEVGTNATASHDRACKNAA